MSAQNSSGQALIQLEDVHFAYGDDSPVLRGIDLDIEDNDYIAVTGQNGSGKTTLVKHFNGLLKPSRGRVLIDGRETTRLSVGELARQVGYVFQNPDYQLFCATTREELSFGPRNLGLDEAEIRRRTEEALEYFDLAAYADTPPAILGYGLRHKVCLAAVYTMRPRIFILDEPTAGLDAQASANLMTLVGDLHQDGHTIILVTHDMPLVGQFCPKTLVLHEGRILLYAPTRQVFAQAAELQAAQIEPPQITSLAQGLADRGFPGDVLTVAEFADAYARRIGGRP